MTHHGHKTSSSYKCVRSKGRLHGTVYTEYGPHKISASDVIRTCPQWELDLEMTLNISNIRKNILLSTVQRHGSIISRYLLMTLASDCDERRVFSCSSCESSYWLWTSNSSTRRIRVNVASTCHARCTMNNINSTYRPKSIRQSINQTTGQSKIAANQYHVL